MFYALVRVKTRFALRAEGVDRDQINAMMDAATDEVVETAVRELGEPAVQATEAVSAAGAAGSILQRIIAFLQSPEGIALVKMLVSILLMLIAL